jgi:hypothetical protein
MSIFSRAIRSTLIATACLASCTAYAQINSNTATVNLNAILGESLTIAASPSTVNFTLAAGAAANGSTPVTVTTSWVLSRSRASVNLYAWFATPAAALSDGGTPANNIASSLVLGQVTTGSPTTFTAFSGTTALGTAGGGLQLFTQAITSTNRAANRSDNLNLRIDLTTVPQLPAGTYTGILTLQAQSL